MNLNSESEQQVSTGKKGSLVKTWEVILAIEINNGSHNSASDKFKEFKKNENITL